MQENTGPLGRLLARAEQAANVNLRLFFSQFAWLLSGQAVGIITALLLALGYAHFLSKETYGTYKYVLSIFSILTVFALPGMGDAAQRGIAQGKEGMFWPTFRKRVQWALLGGSIAAGMGAYYLLAGQVLLGTTFLAAAPFIIVIDAFTHFNSILLGRQLFKHSSTYSAGIQILAAVGIFTTVLLTNNLFIIVISYLSLFVLLRGIAFWHVVASHPLNDARDEEALRYGAHISVTNVINITVGQLDSILLWHFLGAIPLAIYAFAEAAADQAQKAFKLVTTAMAFPKFSAMETGAIKRKLPRQVIYAHGVTIPLAIALALLIPIVYELLFPQYAASIPYAQVMALLLAFTPLRFISTAVNTKAPIRYIYALSIFASTLQVVLLALCIPFFGIWGAIGATGVQQLITNCFALFLFFRM